jgi:hypothetical protein
MIGVASLLAAATAAALLAWPDQWPSRVRLTLAVVASGLLGAAAAVAAVEVGDGWSTSDGVVLASGLLAVVGGGPVTLAVFGLVDRDSTQVVADPEAGVAAKADAPPTSVHAAGRVLRGGAWIGALERAATFATIVAGWPEGVAVVLALKGVARYPELRADGAAGQHVVAERFIIGTFVSLLWAVGCALLGRAA